MEKLKKRKLDPSVIRVGDRVRIVVPQIVERVGYPKTVADYYAETEKALGVELDKFLGLNRPLFPGWNESNQPHYRRNAIHEIAYARAKQDRFGGRRRSLHFKDMPQFAGLIAIVAGVRSVQTGTYYGPSGSDDEWEPGGLDDRRTERLIEVYGLPLPGIQRWSNARGVEFPIANVEKVK